MGYTHYFQRDTELSPSDFKNVAEDFRKIIVVLNKAGLKLAGCSGSGDPDINANHIMLNGVSACGHKEDPDIGIAWPARGAVGSSPDLEKSGSWFAGALLEKRTCGGDCSHEGFILSRTFEPYTNQTKSHGMWFDFCKTAFKPYDLAVTACLVIAKHHFKNDIVVSSDGEMENWVEAMTLCEMELGYGMDFTL